MNIGNTKQITEKHHQREYKKQDIFTGIFVILIIHMISIIVLSSTYLALIFAKI